uniref:Uncharacterized protein LOC112809879 n=1 Tax=Callorhinus ursinus TaxID=34884 RepID=A0A3Q7MPP4_CALUR|nr:uncharacterized protein LOC112809879 [Callorhinus ursinus]
MNKQSRKPRPGEAKSRAQHHTTGGFGSTFHTLDHQALPLVILRLEELSSTPRGKKTPQCHRGLRAFPSRPWGSYYTLQSLQCSGLGLLPHAVRLPSTSTLHPEPLLAPDPAPDSPRGTGGLAVTRWIEQLRRYHRFTYSYQTDIPVAESVSAGALYRARGSQCAGKGPAARSPRTPEDGQSVEGLTHETETTHTCKIRTGETLSWEHCGLSRLFHVILSRKRSSPKASPAKVKVGVGCGEKGQRTLRELVMSQENTGLWGRTSDPRSQPWSPPACDLGQSCPLSSGSLSPHLETGTMNPSRVITRIQPVWVEYHDPHSQLTSWLA